MTNNFCKKEVREMMMKSAKISVCLTKTQTIILTQAIYIYRKILKKENSHLKKELLDELDDIDLQITSLLYVDDKKAS